MDNERQDEDATNTPEESLSEKADSENKNNSISADLIRGHINTIILRTLYERDKYGYEIMNEIEQKSHGQYSLKQPTLYSALKRLESQGYIKAYWKTDDITLGGRRKYFTLTELGKEFAEKNQSEWEYSRTVIDSLISDRSFDFSQPAPVPVDFKLLRKSITRIHTGNNKDEDDFEEDAEADHKDNSEIAHEEKSGTGTPIPQSSAALPSEERSEVKTDEQPDLAMEAQLAPIQAEYTQQSSHPVFVQPEFVPSEPILPQTEQRLPDQQMDYTFRHEQVAPYGEPTYNQHPASDFLQEPQSAPEQSSPPSPLQPERQSVIEEQINGDLRSEEARRIAHENYLKLISADTQQKQEIESDQIAPFADEIDTEKLIYNNKPEPERDYKKLVSNIYSKAIKRSVPPVQPSAPQPVQQPEPVQPVQAMPEPVTLYAPQRDVPLNAATEKGKLDGLKVNTSSCSAAKVNNAKNTTYNIGTTLFKSSAVVGIVMLLEFVFCLIFRENIGVSLAYPLVILALAIAQLGIFAVLMCSGYGKGSARPTNHNYISASIVLTIILILIIALVALLLNMNIQSAGDIMAKMVVPSIVALNIPIFALVFRLFSKLG